MDPHTNLPPPPLPPGPPPGPPPFNPWDPPLPPPPLPPVPPPPPPPPYQWGNPNPTFPGEFHPQFPPFPSPPRHSFPPPAAAANPHFQRKRKFERADDGNLVKLYVGGVPRNIIQEEIYHLFEEHGNVMEVVLLPDKEYCFVKYAFFEEAERAITALHNQFTFPGVMVPIKVKYADAAKRPVGFEPVPKVQHQARVEETLHKLYVNFHNRDATVQDIEEIFSSYGDVADVYLMRDESKNSRGCGFVGFTQRHMAVAAINGLHQSYVMKGCDRPLIVRFAEPKKPKNGQFRPENSVDRWESWDNYVPNDLHLMSLQQSLPSQESPQSSRQTDFQSQTPFHSNWTSITNTEQQHGCQSPQPSGDSGSLAVVPTAEPASCSLSSDVAEDPLDCDWSEHICPDGLKYYFNSETCESRWEKPEEFVRYEQQLRNKQFQNHSCQESLPSSLEDSSIDKDFQSQLSQDLSKSGDTEIPQLAISCAVEHSNEQVPAESIGPACVQ